jgi:hypothetical protein
MQFNSVAGDALYLPRSPAGMSSASSSLDADAFAEVCRIFPTLSGKRGARILLPVLAPRPVPSNVAHLL